MGTRLRPLTNVLPKPLVPVFHEPLANYALRHCQQAGITDFAINTHHLPEKWLESYPERSFEGSPLSFFHEDVLLETGGGIRNIASFIGSDPLLIYNGDIMTDINIKELMDRHTASGNVATLALRSNGENCNVNISGDKVCDMRNLLGNTPGTHQFTGVYCIDPEILDFIPAGEVVSVVPALIELIKSQKLGAVVLNEGDWFDIGNPEAYREVHDYLRTKRTGAIHPDANIHPDAEVDKSSCIVGPGATVEAGACIKNTIVWPGVSVKVGSHHTDAILTGEK